MLSALFPRPPIRGPHELALRLRIAVGAALLVVGGAAAFVTTQMVTGCRSDGGCRDGVCGCPAGYSCDLGCNAPPCHATCAGDNPMCDAVCANGTCTCGPGSHCDFRCDAPPCHVTCDTDTTCSGTCANGQCVCGPRSTCAFTCSASPCHVTCAAGAACVVACPAGVAGTQGCDIVACAAGPAVVCPDGKTTTCGTPCPSP